MKRLIYLFSVLIIAGCSSAPGTTETIKVPADWKEINLVNFRVMAPPGWTIQSPGGGEESFVGGIAGPGVSLAFDYSTLGNSNRLISLEKDYLDKAEWWEGEPGFPFAETKKTIHLPNPDQKARFPLAQYMADLRYKNKFASVPVEVPSAVREHNFKVDSTEKYVFKTITPKVTGKGMTGVYIHSRKSPLSFQMHAFGLSLKDQETVLKVFKTIQFKQDQ